MKHFNLRAMPTCSICTLALMLFPSLASAADDAAADYESLQRGFQERMDAAPHDNDARKAILLDHASRLAELAANKSGMSAEMALVDSMMYFQFGGETEVSDKAFDTALKRLSHWPSKMRLLGVASIVGKEEAGRAYANGLREEAATSGSKVNDLSEALRQFGDNEGAIALIDRYLATSQNEEMKAQLERKKAAFALKVGAPPMEFFAKVRQTGETLSIAQLKGKVVLLDFWATWCPPCIGELPNVQKTYADFHDKGFEIVGISLDEDLAALDAFIKDKAMPWPQLADGKGWQSEIVKLYCVNGIPFTILIGRDGLIKGIGLRGSDLYQMVEKALPKGRDA